MILTVNYIRFVLLFCAVLTVLSEVCLSILLGLRKKDLLYVFLVNILTNPLLNAIVIYVYINFGKSMYYIVLISLELVVVLVEGLIYKKVLSYKKINWLLLSVILNVFSFLIGLFY